MERDHVIPGRVRVLVRCRPIISTEQGHSTNRVHITDSKTVAIKDGQVNGDARQFVFDRVISPSADQTAMFEEVIPLVDHVLSGFHATVFAYGQTGSGKTHTMEGLTYQAGRKGAIIPDFNTPVEQHGILPRVIQLLFDRARERQQASNDGVDPSIGEPTEQSVLYSFKCSYYQIYNEVISDLLRPIIPNRKSGMSSALSGSTSHSGLRLRWQKGDSFQVENLFQCECTSAEQMRSVVFSGVKEKVVSSHLMNHQSSRSHCIFTVYVEAKEAKSGDIVSRSELSLVDLAGSEKIGQLSHDPSDKLFKESIEINTSLLALGKVITALATGRDGKLLKNRRQPNRHVPYRDSKLTMLLKHALGGNSITMMIACISPSDKYVDESMSTLLYAGRARNIENVPQINEDPTTALIKRLRAEVAQLKEELRYYQALVVQDGLLRGRQPLAVSVKPQTQGWMAEGPTLGSQPQSEYLADSLIDACGMLQQVLSVNGKLRDAYDMLRESIEAADRRECGLNAENLSLRERIEMLESIALSPEFAFTEEPLTKKRDKSLKRKPQQLADEVVHPPQAPQADLDEWKGAYYTPTVKGTVHHDLVSEPHAATAPHTAGMPAEVSAPRPKRKDQLVLPAASQPLTPSWTSEQRAPQSAPEPPQPMRSAVMDKRPLGTQGMAKSRPITTSSPPRARSPAEPRPLPRTPSPLSEFPPADDVPPQKPSTESVGGPGRMGKMNPTRDLSSSTRQRSRSVKKKKKLSKRLAEYEARYRSPGHTATYAEYYGRVQPTTTQRTLNTTMSLKENEAVRKMSVYLKKLSPEFANELLPASLKKPGQFGDLSFGGERKDMLAFEAKRNDRGARLAALLEKQNILRSSIQQEIQEKRQEAATSGVSPEEGGDIVNGSMSFGSGRRTHNRHASPVSPYSRVEFDVGGRYPSDTNSRSVSRNASHKASGLSASGSQSMDRLLQYLKRERPTGIP